VNDCILIAGKGAERYQQIGDIKYPFDDVTQVSRYLNEAVKANNGDS
jgi:UDP-N-acetylmuramyl tripeptide synthase